MAESNGIYVKQIPAGAQKDDIWKTFEFCRGDIQFIIFPLYEYCKSQAYIHFTCCPEKVFDTEHRVLDQIVTVEPVELPVFHKCSAEVDAVFIASMHDIDKCVTSLQQDFSVKASYSPDTGVFVVEGIPLQLEQVSDRLRSMFIRQKSLQTIQLQHIKEYAKYGGDSMQDVKGLPMTRSSRMTQHSWDPVWTPADDYGQYCPHSVEGYAGEQVHTHPPHAHMSHCPHCYHGNHQGCTAHSDHCSGVGIHQAVPPGTRVDNRLMPGVGICQVVPTRTRIDGTVAVDQTVRPLPLIPTSRNMSPTCGGTFPESGGKLDQTVAGSGDHIIKSPVTEPTGVNHGQAEPSGMTTSDLDYYVVEYLMRCSQALIRNIEQEFGVTVKCVNRVCEDIVTVAFQRFNPVIKVENEEKAQQEFLSLYEGTYRNIVQRTIHVSSASPSNKTAEYFVNLVTNTNTDKMKIVAIATGTNDVMLVGPYETVSMVENFIHSQLDGDRRTVEGTIARPEVTSGTGLMEEHDGDDDDDYYYYSQHHDVDYFEYTCNDKVKVKIYTADITKLTVDVIVNAANERLLNYGGVAGAIERVGGEQLRDDCQRIVDRDGPLKVAEVVHTVARGRLKCRYVVHTVGPMWMLSSDKALCATLLQHTFENVLHYSNHVLKAKTLAVPAIGSGIFEVPLDVSAQTMFKAIQELTEKVSEFTLHEIHLVNNDTNTTHLIRTIFEHLLTTTSQPTPASSTREDSRDKVVLAADVGSPEALKDECGRDISKSVEKDDESRKKGHKDVDHEVEGIRLEKSEKVYELDNLTEELSLEDRNLNPLIDKTDSDIKSSTGKLGFDLETAPGENDVDLETATGNTNHDLDGDNVEIVKSAVDGCGFDTELSCLPKSTYSEAEKCQPSSDSDLNPGRDG